MIFLLPVILTIGCVIMDHWFLLEMDREHHAKAAGLKTIVSLCFLLVGFWFAFAVSPAGGRKTIVAIALLLGLAGDVLLALRFVFREKFDLMFLLGGLSFAAGHVLYIIYLLGRDGKAWLPGLPFWVAGLAVCAFFALKFKADAGPMQIPGYGYMALVFAMGAIACGAAVRSFGTSQILFALGGIFFAVSDTILAIHCFGTAKQMVYNRWVHYTYYAAQLLIAWSLAFV